MRTLAEPRHSREFGGAAPDALLVLLHAPATLHDGHGDMTVAGLRREAWMGASHTEDEFRELAGVEPGLPLFGTGNLGERLWSGPAVTVIGIDVPSRLGHFQDEKQRRDKAALRYRTEGWAPGGFG